MIGQELQALIKYIQLNKASDSDWFTITSNKEGTHWSGKCWYVHELIKYEFDFEFDIPATYPATAPEIRIPSLDGKTAKMYRGGAICLTVHFKPLWAKNRWGAHSAAASHVGFCCLTLGMIPSISHRTRTVHGSTSMPAGRAPPDGRKVALLAVSCCSALHA